MVQTEHQVPVEKMVQTEQVEPQVVQVHQERQEFLRAQTAHTEV